MPKHTITYEVVPQLGKKLPEEQKYRNKNK